MKIFRSLVLISCFRIEALGSLSFHWLGFEESQFVAHTSYSLQIYEVLRADLGASVTVYLGGWTKNAMCWSFITLNSSCKQLFRRLN